MDESVQRLNMRSCDSTRRNAIAHASVLPTFAGPETLQTDTNFSFAIKASNCMAFSAEASR
eukprot:1395539-Prymnesium_polylepis.1